MKVVPSVYGADLDPQSLQFRSSGGLLLHIIPHFPLPLSHVISPLLKKNAKTYLVGLNLKVKEQQCRHVNYILYIIIHYIYTHYTYIQYILKHA